MFFNLSDELALKDHSYITEGTQKFINFICQCSYEHNENVMLVLRKRCFKVVIKKQHNTPIKKNQLKNYMFNIILNYEINTSSEKVIIADFYLTESMDNLNYNQLQVNLVEIVNLI